MSNDTPTSLQIATRLLEHIPYSQVLGMRVVHAEPGHVIVEAPSSDELIGDSQRGWLHSGLATTLIDSACAIAFFVHRGKFEPVATLDLRMDYLQPALAGKALRCRAECVRVARSIAFTKAVVYQDNPEDAIATCIANFMRLKAPAP